MSRRLGTLGVGAVLLVLLGAVGSMLPVPYVALGPGPTYNTVGDIDGQDVITVTGREPNETSGNLNLTTVQVRDGLELFRAIQGWLDDEESVVPREEVYPPDQSEEEIDRANRQQFLNSQNTAEAAALRELGYPMKVVVAEVPGESPAAELEAVDVIESIDGVEVTEPDVLLDALAGVSPGTPVTIGYSRDGEPAETEVVTTQAQEGDGAALGILISYERKAPFEVAITVDNVGGPSAGLMLALGIIDLVGDTDLTEGAFVAGSGTISAEGEVGPIGGIRLKIIKAEDVGADVFLVPAANCAEALIGAPEDLPLARVATLEEALTALADVRAGRTPASC